jgi:hypothetical protein
VGEEEEEEEEEEKKEREGKEEGHISQEFLFFIFRK